MKKNLSKIFISSCLCLCHFIASATITVNTPAAGATVASCANMTINYSYTGSFSTYAIVNLHLSSTGAIVKTWDYNHYYLSPNYNCQVPMTGVSPGTYYLEIYDNYNHAQTGNSGVFTVAANNSNPVLELTGQSFVEINWAPVTGATSYAIKVMNGATLVASLTSSGGTDPYGYYITGLSAATTYSITIQTTTACGTSGVSTALTVTTCTAVTAPSNNSPTSVTSNSITVSWNPPTSGAYDYQVIVTSPSSMTSTYTTGTTMTLTGLSAYTNYTYYVRAEKCNAYANGAPQTTRTLMDSPVISSSGPIENGCFNFSESISWSTPTGAVSFQLYQNGYPIGSGSNSYSSSFAYNSYTTFQVKATAGNGTTSWSGSEYVSESTPYCCTHPNDTIQCRFFVGRVASSPKPAPKATGFLVNTYPNPASETLRVTLTPKYETSDVPIEKTTTLEEPLALKIFNINGQVVTQGSGQLGEATVDVRTLPPGTYVLHTTVRGTIQRQKIIITR